MDSLQKLLEMIGYEWIGEAKGIAECRLKANGLRVLLVENHSAPVVTFMKLYRVGSRNEGAGNSGATHFLEHMMFKGTNAHNPADGRGFDDVLKPMGALYNATTWFDRTNYFECVGSEHLDTCIALEADRMRNLVLKKEDRDSEMSVVRNEFERGENDPDDVLDKEIWKNAFLEHPYHIPTIGWRSDVEGVPMERLKEFYDTFYWPNNCTVIVVGDFDPGTTLRQIAKHFGKIPASPKPIPEMYTVEPPQEGERRFKIRRAGDLARVGLAFHVPQANHPDNYPLAAMAAILGGTRRSSRLYKRLIDSGLASAASSMKWELRDPALFTVYATVSHDAKSEDVEAAVLDEVAKLAAEPVSDDELRRAKAANRKGTTLAAADPMAYARQIAEAEACANWHWLVEYDDKFDAVTPADIQRVARTYFGQDNRTVGYFTPKEEEKPAAESPVEPPKGDTSGLAPVPRAEESSFAKQVQRTVLPNGMVVQVMRNQGTGSVGLSGNIRAGDYFAPNGNELIPSLVAYMLSKGSAKFSKTAIAETLEEMGTNLQFGSGTFAVNFGSSMGHVVAEDLPAYVALMADLLRNPLFLADELKKSKKEWVSFLKTEMSQTNHVARAKLLGELFGPENVYHHKPYEQMLKDLEAVTVADLKAFHKAHYSPQGTILSVVGDMDEAAMLKLVTDSFGDWSGPAAKPIDEHRLSTLGDRASKSSPQSPERIEIPLADKANVDIRIGLAAPVKRTAKDYFAAKLANAALGEDTLASRLGLVVREKNGLTYGIHSRFENIDFGGAPWVIDLSVNPANVEKALALVDEVVNQYRAEGITDKELSDEAGRAIGSFKVRLRTSAGIAQGLTYSEFVGLGVAGMDSYADQVMAVTRDEVNAAIQSYFRLDNAVTVLAGTFAKKA